MLFKKAAPTRIERRDELLAEINQKVAEAADVTELRSLASHLESLAEGLRLKWATTAPVI